MAFAGFTLEQRDVGAGALTVCHGGSGPALLLLHGNPQTHMMWHAVASALAERFTVVCPDLRGYGRSFKPEPSADHAAYAKREMARDMVALMSGLGHERFLVAGHDRGGRVAHRLALDHPERVERLAIMDIVPTIEHFERTDMAFGMGYYHWFWLAQPYPVPETLINAAPEAWFRLHTSRGGVAEELFAPEALADYLDAIRRPATVSGICEDYRAAASIDLVHDRASRSDGIRIQCPLQVLWGGKGKIGIWYDAPAIWRQYCDDEVVTGVIPSGHYLAEEAPVAVLSAFKEFFG